MSIFELMDNVDNQILALEKNRAILMTVAEEVDEYERTKVNFRGEHVSLLLDAAVDIILTTMAELKQISSKLYEKHGIAKQLVE